MRKKKKRNLKRLLSIIIVLAVIVASLIIIESGILNNLNEQEQLVVNLEDECGVLLNNLIHQIKTENNCESICKNECVTQKRVYDHVEFIQNQESCNECTCFCN